jgi:hypothetical protein
MMLGSVASEVGEVKGKGEKEIRDGSDTLALIFECQTMDSLKFTSILLPQTNNQNFDTCFASQAMLQVLPEFPA